MVWCDPCNSLALHFCLEVDSLDGEEHLSKSLRLDDVMHELHGQPLAVVHHVSLKFGGKAKRLDASSSEMLTCNRLCLGRVANRNSMQRASSKSLSASVKVGYLYG